MKFFNFRNCSENTFVKGVPAVEDIVKRSKKLGLPGATHADKNNMYGHVQLVLNCQKGGPKGDDETEAIKPVFATNLFSEKIVAGRAVPDVDCILVPRNMDGYRNHLKLLTAFITDLSYRKSRLENKPASDISGIEPEDVNPVEEVDDEITTNSISDLDVDSFLEKEKAKGLCKDMYVLLSAETAETRYAGFEQSFGAENIRIELPMNASKERFEELKAKYGIDRLVVSSQMYYIDKEESQEKIVYEAIFRKETIDQIKDPWDGFHFKTTEEATETLSKICSKEDIEKMFQNALDIVSVVDIAIVLGKVRVPVFEIEGKDLEIYEANKDKSPLKLNSNEWYLRYLCYSNMNERYGTTLTLEDIIKLVGKNKDIVLEGGVPKFAVATLKELAMTHFPEDKQALFDSLPEDKKDLVRRLEYELLVINKMGYDAYFLIVSEYINWAKNNGVPVGPGRGSGAGSLAVYLTKITDIDPIRWGLLFERFLSPGRVTCPDIDTDFADEGRGSVVQHCVDKYGANRVIPVDTFGTWAARSAITDVSRVMGIPAGDVRRLTSTMNSKPGVTLESDYKENEVFRREIDASDAYTNVYNIALKLEGKRRQLGVHACAVIISPEDMTNFTALQFPPKATDKLITQLEAHDIGDEGVGLLKMDFLGLKNLTILKNCLALIKERHGKDIDLLRLDLYDQNVYQKIFQTGYTTNVFQFESHGMKKYMKQLKPDRFEDLIAMVALYRPGPMDFIPSYIDRKHGRENVDSLHSSLDDILKDTFSIVVFQEQIMLMSQAFAGFSMAEADTLRKAVGKKNQKLIAKERQHFIDGAQKMGNDPVLAAKIYDETVVPAGRYSFNKSHAACYAFISYQTAWLKCYYPAEYIVACMMSDAGDHDRVSMAVDDAEEMGIKVVPITLNESDYHWTVIDDKTIRMGLASIKRGGENGMKYLVQDRNLNGKYTSVSELITRLGENFGKTMIVGLAKCGGLGDMAELATIMHPDNIEMMKRLSSGKNAKKGVSKKKATLKGMFEVDAKPVKDGTPVVEKRILKFKNPITGEQKEVPEAELPFVFVEPASGYERAKQELASIGVNLRFSFMDGLVSHARSIEVNRALLFGKKNNTRTARKSREVSLIGVMDQIYFRRDPSNKEYCTFALTGVDYRIEGTLYSAALDQHKSDLRSIIKAKEKPIVEVSGIFSIGSRRKITVENMRIYRDVEKYLGALKGSMKYIHGDDIGPKAVLAYENMEIDNTIDLYINIDEDILKDAELRKKLQEKYLPEFKECLASRPRGNVHVWLKGPAGDVKDTKFLIDDSDAVKAYFEKTRKWGWMSFEK